MATSATSCGFLCQRMGGRDGPKSQPAGEGSGPCLQPRSMSHQVGRSWVLGDEAGAGHASSGPFQAAPSSAQTHNVQVCQLDLSLPKLSLPHCPCPVKAFLWIWGKEDNTTT